MAKAHVHYQALLNERSAAVIPTSLKVTSRASGFKVMDPFDWTKDKAIYQRWQMWSERLDMPLMLWKVIQKRLKFHSSTIGLMVKEWGKLNPGRTKNPQQSGGIQQIGGQRRQVLFRKNRKLLHTV